MSDGRLRRLSVNDDLEELPLMQVTLSLCPKRR
jgi:hypothetical protein